MEREESGGRNILVELPGRGRDEVHDAGSDYASGYDTEPCEGIDLDGQLRHIGLEGFFVDPEDKLLIPSGVCLAILVHPGGELAIWVDPCDRVSAHGLGHRGQVLGRDQVELQKPPVGNLWSHRTQNDAAAAHAPGGGSWPEDGSRWSRCVGRPASSGGWGVGGGLVRLTRHHK